MPAFAVDPAEVAAILALTIPPHETTFDDGQVLSLIAHSLALDQQEKVEMVASLGSKSQEQIDGLIAILLSEVEEIGTINEATDRKLDDAKAHHLRQQFRLV